MNDLANLLLLQGQIASRQLPRGYIRNLSDVEFSVFSQFGEDGIIEWLAIHLGQTRRKFVEFGVENFHQSNCRFLMQNRNWKGLVMDASPDHIRELKGKEYYWMHGLNAVQAFITRENINDIIRSEGFDGDIGILSIDLDGNDYWVWDHIDVCKPDIVICEYNSLFGDRFPVCVPYDPGFHRFRSHHSGRYYGASLPAIRHMGESKGYVFIGTTSTGHNAFFVHRSVSASILSLLGEIRGFPSRSRHIRDPSGELEFYAHVTTIFQLLGDLPVIDTESGKQIQLKEIVRPYSDEWTEYMS